MLNLKTQFNKLKEIRPDDQWKRDNRDVLLRQIGVGDKVQINDRKENIFVVFNVARVLFRQLSQPIGVVMLLLSVMIGGGVLSIFASGNAKPGDSLYIAKKINEKAQSAFTFDEEAKIKLALVFAENRAREIAKVIEEAKVESDKKQEHVDKLTQDLRNEITKIKKAKVRSNNLKSKNNVAVKDEAEVEDEVVQVFSAHLGKSDKGMQISEGSVNSTDSTFDEVLDEAKVLIGNKDYEGTLEKLEQANAMIVKETEEASSVEGENDEVVEEGEADVENFEQENEHDIIVDNLEATSDGNVSGFKEDTKDSIASSSEEVVEEVVASSSDVKNSILE